MIESWPEPFDVRPVPPAGQIALNAGVGRVGLDRLGLRRLGVVEGDDVLDALLGADPREREDPGSVRRVALDLGAAAQRRVVGLEVGEVAEEAVERVGLVEVGDRRRGARADQVVVVIGGDLARHHVLARVLVAAVAGEALLVAVVDDRHPADEVHQRMGQLVAGSSSASSAPGLACAMNRPIRPMSWLPRKVGRL